MSVCACVTVFACLCECVGVNVCLCVCLHVMYVCDMHTYKNLKIKTLAGWCKAQDMETPKRESPLDEKQLKW